MNTIFDKLIALVNNRDLEGLKALYHNEAVLIPTIKQVIIRGNDNIINYYKELIVDIDIQTKVMNIDTKLENGNQIVTGLCHVTWMDENTERVLKVRVSLLLHEGKILVHHANDLTIE